MAESERDPIQPLSLPRKPTTIDAGIDITPMIDIVFLLLIFFLVASKMDEAASVKLPPAERGQNVSQENAIIVIVKKNERGEIVVARRDGSPFSRQIEQQEAQIGKYVEAGLSGAAPFGRPMHSIILKAQRDVREGEVARVAEAIGRVTDISVLHYAVLEQP